MKTSRSIATGILALFLVTGSGNVFAAPSGAVAQGNISVYKGGQLADTLTGQNPVDSEALLVCNGKCMIKSPGISLIGSDGARLAIKNEQEMFNLLVNRGRVDFIVTDSINKMSFYTPDGGYASADLLVNASTNTPVRGYMQVADDGTTEIGVEEGRMIFSTPEGPKTVDSTNTIRLAMVPAGAAAGAGAAGAGAGIGAGTIALGAAAIGLGAWGVVAIANNSSSDSNNNGFTGGATGNTGGGTTGGTVTGGSRPGSLAR